MEKVFYQTDEKNNCTEKCDFANKDFDVFIGSNLCYKCKQNVSHNPQKKWIKCKIYSTLIEAGDYTYENQKLKDRNDRLNLRFKEEQEYIKHLCKIIEEQNEEIQISKYKIDDLEREIIVMEDKQNG